MRGFVCLSIFFCALSSPAQPVQTIVKELNEIFDRNLKLRNHVLPTIQKHGYQSNEMDSLNRLIEVFDSISLIKVVSLIEEKGWLGMSEVGEKANLTLFLVIQHAPNNSVRKKFFPLLKASAERGESDLASMATMQDRILIEDGEKQVYGTQSKIVNDKLEYLPIQDPRNLNNRRKKVGLKRIKIN